MKHGGILLVLLCCATGAVFASDRGLSPLTEREIEAIVGGDLTMVVDRDRQEMVVTRTNPNQPNDFESYTVKVTTAVVRNSDVRPDNPKGAMKNGARPITHKVNSTVPENQTRFPTQFPTGTAKLSPVVGT